MRIINLIENTKGNEECLYEHGLSFYIETPKHKIIVDMGATDKFIYNSEKLGVNLEDVDMCVLSHGHYDHSGGILGLYEVNKNACLLMNNLAGEDYYHVYYDENGNYVSERYIGIDKRILNLPNVRMIESDITLDEEISVFTGVKGRRLWPKGNLVLKVKKNNVFYQDEFEHEQYLVIKEGNNSVLVSGCAHNGILNILDRYKEIYDEYPNYVISGFHMMNKSGYSVEDIEIIKETANELKKLGIKFFTGHCTGEIPFEIMKEIMGERICYVHSGEYFEL